MVGWIVDKGTVHVKLDLVFVCMWLKRLPVLIVYAVAVAIISAIVVIILFAIRAFVAVWTAEEYRPWQSSKVG